MRLAGYIRVSSDVQVDAFGKDIQRDGILKAAELLGHEIVEWFEEDGVSGTKDSGHRPALSDLIDRAQEFDGVMCFDATRIARRVVVQETLLGVLWNAGLRVFTSTNGEIEQNEDDPTKILIRQILGILAEFDHRTTVKKLSAGKRAKAAQGGYVGGTPRYGVRVVGSGKSAQIVEDEVESQVIEAVVAWYSEGKSLRWIAENLNDAGKRTKLGKRWSAMQIQRIVKRRENV
jgi:DNA invertase Pin-like site-specific DNA recombinase